MEKHFPLPLYNVEERGGIDRKGKNLVFQEIYKQDCSYMLSTAYDVVVVHMWFFCFHYFVPELEFSVMVSALKGRNFRGE